MLVKNTLFLIIIGSLHLAKDGWCEVQQPDPCDVKNVATAISNGNITSWNQGFVRSRGVQGGFWSIPWPDNPSTITKKLGDGPLSRTCNIQVSNLGAYSVRIVPKEKVLNSGSQTASIISPFGTTLGLLKINTPSNQSTLQDNLIILYPAKVASEIAKGSTAGTGLTKIPIDKTSLQTFSEDLEIEYNFRDIQINILGLTGQATLKDTAERLIGNLRRQGFASHPTSESTVKALDSLWPPQSHESFWIKADSILRLEITKLKRGNVRVNLHESKQIRK